MDTLEANLGGLLPITEGESSQQQATCDEFENALLPFRDETLTAIKTITSARPQWNCETPAKVLLITHTMCRFLVTSAFEAKQVVIDFENLQEPLTLLVELLRQVLSAPDLFQQRKEREKFRRRALHMVKSTKKVLARARELDATLETYHQKQANDLRPALGEVERDRGLWPVWSSNSIRVGSAEQRKAIVGKTDFRAVAAYLPRGGFAIVEQWRADVNETVESILQVCDAEGPSAAAVADAAKINRTEEAEAQSATHYGTYLTPIDEGVDNLTRTMRLVNQPGGHALLGCLPELEPLAPGQQPFGLWETTFINITRMREAYRERASKLEDFGRTW